LFCKIVLKLRKDLPILSIILPKQIKPPYTRHLVDTSSYNLNIGKAFRLFHLYYIEPEVLDLAVKLKMADQERSLEVLSKFDLQTLSEGEIDML